jgi:secreted trypsin-like serine protease
MNRIKFIAILTTLCLATPTANAIENGFDATDSSFIVPIYADYSSTSSTGCSGGLIAPKIVITAGHCVLNETGLISKDIRVGPSGSDQTLSRNTWIKVVSVQMTASLSSSGTKVQDNDIVFLVLASPLVVKVPIRLASEAEVQTLKSTGATLRIYGYGYIDNLGKETKFPRYLDQQFENVLTHPFANSAYSRSKTGAICKGDSGGPILKITATEVVLIGIVTGSVRDTTDNCGRIRTSLGDNYYTVFTLISRYTNLAFAAANYVMKADQDAYDAYVTKSMADLQEALLDVDRLTTEAVLSDERIEGLLVEIEDLNGQIAKLNKQIPTTITCIKGKLTKKVTAVKPKCPAGYNQK